MVTIKETLNEKYPDEYSMLISIIGSQASTTLSTDQVDYLLYMAIDRATKAICNYTGWDMISTGYEGTTAALALQYLLTDTSTARLFMGNPIVASQTQGGRSATYKSDTPVFDADGLTTSVKAALPLPMLKVY